MFHYKLKILKKALTQWSKKIFGNIFQEIANLEDVIKVVESHFKTEPNVANREKLHEAQAKLKLYLHREEKFLKQKEGMQWSKDGKSNTKFFHTIVNGRRWRIKVNKTQNEEEEWMENQEDIVDATGEFYRNQFKRQEGDFEYAMIEGLPNVLSDEESENMHAEPTIKKVYQAVMGLNRHSTRGPDRMIDAFYQDAWEA
ncbi:uncharacterized protein LOC124896867 [Capsicum annuum]|uniref:uncharacterized protein LOC124896867 n=1 Tax=Capsicum annuum TaxID=4072 RepID=UPI001FB125DE|nr:uncharacterized protein LOC124896867 [Capsicum annuum]